MASRTTACSALSFLSIPPPGRNVPFFERTTARRPASFRTSAYALGRMMHRCSAEEDPKCRTACQSFIGLDLTEEASVGKAFGDEKGCIGHVRDQNTDDSPDPPLPRPTREKNRWLALGSWNQILNDAPF